MNVNVLGPLEVQENDVSIVPSAGKPRQILALLALNSGRVVTTSTMMEEIWGDDIPRSAATTLQTYILQLRKKIAQVCPGRQPKRFLETCLGGYQLKVDPGTLDSTQFENHAKAGSIALERRDYRTASATLDSALRLWRGPMLVDVPVGRVLELDVLGLEETRMRVLEQRIEADLGIGKHSLLLGELHRLVAEYPMHENFCAQFMLALHRTGNAWRALEAFQKLRRVLIDELAIEPSGRLQQLYRAILAGDQGSETSRP